MNDEIYELRAEWLSDYNRTEDDVLFDEDKGSEYINVEKEGSIENDDGTLIDTVEGFKKIYLPDNLQV